MEKQNYYQKNKEKLRSYMKRQYHENHERYLAIARKSRIKNKDKRKQDRANWRLAVIRFYSNGRLECNCCKESTLAFLSLDHIYNNGAEERKKVKTVGSGFYKWLINRNFPPGYQILCYNCNFTKGLYGECVHKLTFKDRD